MLSSLEEQSDRPSEVNSPTAKPFRRQKTKREMGMIKNMHETLKKLVETLYGTVRSIIEEILALAMIHAGLISLFVLLVVSLVHVSLFSAGFFFIFIFLLCFTPHKRKRVWIFLVIYTSIVLFCEAAYLVFEPNVTERVSSFYLKVIGFTYSSKNSYLFNYADSLVVFFVATLQQYIYASQRFKDYLTQLDEFEASGEREPETKPLIPLSEVESSVVKEEAPVKHSSKRRLFDYSTHFPDAATVFTIRYSLWIMVAMLFAFMLISKFNILCYIFVIFLSIQLLVMLFAHTTAKIYKYLRPLFITLSVYCAVVVFLEYIMQFPIITAVLPRELIKIGWGDKSNAVTTKLVLVTCVMVLAQMNTHIMNNKQARQIIEKEWAPNRDKPGNVIIHWLVVFLA